MVTGVFFVDVRNVRTIFNTYIAICVLRDLRSNTITYKKGVSKNLLTILTFLHFGQNGQSSLA